MENKIHIEFEPVKIEGDCPSGSTLLECARQLGVELVSVCGGKGTCGHCIIRVLEGNVSAIEDAERKFLNTEMLAGGYRLACRTRLLSNSRVYVPAPSLSTMQRIQVEGKETPVEPEPAVTSCLLSLKPPTLEDVRPDFERLADSVAKNCRAEVVTPDLEILRLLSSEIRTKAIINAALRGNEIVGFLPGDSHPLGLAVDIGTTKIAAYLVDLSDGRTLDTAGIANPQEEYGADIIARMAAAMHSETAAVKLQELVSAAINRLAGQMCSGLKLDTGNIVDIVIAGNTAMHHLFLRLPVKQLALAPYVPAVDAALDIKAREAGLKFAAGAYLHMLPNIAGYVGADHVAMLLAAGILRKDGVVLAIDIGTNTEMCLANNHLLTSLSCASGPAFEGAHIKHGMRVANGAIEHLRLSGSRVEYQTIGNKPPVGICGSGIIDTLAQLYLGGVVDSKGKMLEHPLVREANGIREFVIAAGGGSNPEVTFTQKDVRELQLAKGAVATGIRVLLKENKLQENDISEVIIAGAFGTYIDVESARAIGMLPDLPVERFQQVGNAAGMGAKMALISKTRRLEAQEIAKKVHYVELASYPGFNDIFTQTVNIGKL